MTNQLKGLRDALNAKHGGRQWQWRPVGAHNWATESARTGIADLNLAQYEFRAAPESISRPWEKPEDVPLNCWIRYANHPDIFLITSIQTNGIGWSGGNFREWIHFSGFDYSTDRKQWLPCTVEERA